MENGPLTIEQTLFLYIYVQVQHALKKSEKALDTLNKAINIDPKNPLCKFHRASVLFANEKYKVSKGYSSEILQAAAVFSYKKSGPVHANWDHL